MNETLSEARGRNRIKIALEAKNQVLALKTFSGAKSNSIKKIVNQIKMFNK